MITHAEHADDSQSVKASDDPGSLLGSHKVGMRKKAVIKSDTYVSRFLGFSLRRTTIKPTVMMYVSHNSLTSVVDR